MQTLPVIFSQVIWLVSNPPGSLVYHLVLLFAFQAAAAIAFGQWRTSGAGARLFWAAAGLFVVRLVLLVVSLLEAAGLAPQLAVVPPLDRAASTLTILIIVWAFAFPKTSQLADAFVAALALLTLIGLAISWGLWLQEIPPAGSAEVYNGSAQESVWEIAQLVLLAVGSVLLVVRRTAAWFIGLALIFLLLVVHGLQLLLPLPGNVPGLVRLVEIVALPMFTALVYLRAHAPLAGPAPAPVTLSLPGSTVLSPSAVNARALVALASLNATADLDQRRQNLTLALGYLYQADLALFILPPDKKGAATVACCFRVSRGQFASRPDLVLKAFPAVTAVFQSGETALLTAAEHEVELRRLTADMGVEGVGFGLLAPVTLSPDYPVGMVALVASAARPAWTVEDQNLLGTLTRSLAEVFDVAEQISALRREIQSQQARADAAEERQRVVQEAAEKLMGELAQAQTLNLQVTAQLNQAQSAAQSHTPDLGADATQAEQRRRDEERNRLEVELEAAQEGLAALALLQGQCKSLSEETEQLRRAKAEMEKEVEQLRGDLQSAEEQLHVFNTSDHVLESEAQQQQTAQLRLELELARMELRGAADRRSALLEQAEKDKQALTESVQAGLAAVQAELEEKKVHLQQLTESGQQREAELSDELSRARAELQAALGRQAELEKAAEAAQAQLQQAEAALADKALDSEQREAEQTAQEAQLVGLTAELERVRAELQQAAARADSLAQAERQGRAALAEAQAASNGQIEECKRLVAEQHEREAALSAQLASQSAQMAALEQAAQQREGEQMAQAAERTMEWECLQADLREAQMALADKTLQMQQLTEQHQVHSDDMTVQVEGMRAELEQAGKHTAALLAQIAALEQAQKQQAARMEETLAVLAAAQAALAEETLDGEKLTEQHRQREAEWNARAAEHAAELERIRADGQQALGRNAALEQAEQQQRALAQEAQAALAAARGELTEQMAQLRRLTEEYQRRETEQTSTLEQTRTELRQALDQQSSLKEAEEERQEQLQEVQSALATARAGIAGQAAAFVVTQEKLAAKERELAEALANLKVSRQSQISPAAQTTLERVATLAQDLRQPIMSITGYVSLLLGESVGLVGAVQKKFLERIQAACERLEMLLNDLSQASEVAFAARPLEMGNVSVTRLVEEALQGSESLLREKGIHLRLELAENLPVLQADAVALRQVFSGLIHNAASATPLNGEVRLVVRRETQTSKEEGPSDCIFVSVKDSGSGLAPEDLPKVFSSEVSWQEAPLAGLGDAGRDLVSLRPLVEAHRGRIWVTSEPGQGSLFSMLLPVTESPATRAANVRPPESAEPPLPEPKALDFLVLPPD